jgi:hypothetical protein
MADGRRDENGARDRDMKERLIKTARMYTMCRNAAVAEPMDVAALALAAFEDMQLPRAMVFVRSNERNIRDLAWAFENSSSAQEFEQRVKEIRYLSDN